MTALCKHLKSIGIETSGTDRMTELVIPRGDLADGRPLR
jgi:hypothetical protein